VDKNCASFVLMRGVLRPSTTLLLASRAGPGAFCAYPAPFNRRFLRASAAGPPPPPQSGGSSRSFHRGPPRAVGEIGPRDLKAILDGNDSIDGTAGVQLVDCRGPFCCCYRRGVSWLRSLQLISS